MHYLFYDCETSGRNSKNNAILTAYFIIYDEDWNRLDELELFLKPDDGNVLVEDGALEVNGIDLDLHLKDKRTLPYSEGKEVLMSFLSKHKIKGKRRHFRPCGQNIKFDEDFIINQLVPEKEWRSLVHYRCLDTLDILTFLQDIKFLPKDLGNLESQVDYFNIPKGKAHDARDDIIMTVDVYKAYRKLLIDKKDNISSVSNNDLLSIIER
jgi:oligoribonuclease (3'-5' exoribonuclease)